MHDWNDFYVATAGAAAALTGLIFVGISINLPKILSYPSLPIRASVSLILLMSVLLFSLLMLLPRESTTAIGWLVFIAGFIVWAIITRADFKIYKLINKEYKRLFLYNLLFDQLAVLPYLAGGLCILFVGEKGLYCLAAAFVFSFIKAVSDAWVLLIEILR